MPETPNAKTFVAIAIIIVIVVGLAIASGIIPFKLPKQANLISVSQVNLASGGQAQGQYLVKTYWNIVYQASTAQQTILVLNGNCASSNCASTSLTGTFNGATVNATSQLYVTITPGQPIAWVGLTQQSVTWAQQATGLLCENPFGAFNNCQKTVPAQGPIPVLTSGTGATWHYYFPLTVTVQKIGGGDPFTESKTIDSFSVSSLTMNNPNDPNENLTINGLGANIGSEGLPSASVTGLQIGSQWYVFGGYDISGISEGYNTYWYNGQQQFQTLGGESAADQRYASPGWDQLQEAVHEECLLGSCLINTNAFYYSPVAPSLTNSPTGTSTSNTYPLPSPVPGTSASITVTNTTRSGLGLLPWMQQNYGIFSPYHESVGYGGGMSINSTTLQINLPSDVLLPEVQLLASTQMVDTVIYQQNNAIFRISNLASNPTSIYDGENGIVTMDVTDTSSFQGMATIVASQSTTAFGIEPTSQNVQLNAGQTKQVSFSVKGLAVQSKTQDQLSFQAVNGLGQITDTKSITLTALPTPIGSAFFTIQSICLSNAACSGTKPDVNVTSGGQATVYVTILSGGAQGAAYLSVKSGDSTIATISPSSYNQTLGSSATQTFQFYVSGVSTGSTTVSVSVANSTATNDHAIFTVSVNGAPPPPCITNCPPPLIPWTLYLGLAMIGIAMVGIVVYYFRRK